MAPTWSGIFPLGIISARAYDILTKKEAARKLGISHQHVRYLLARGEIDGKRLGRDWVVLSLDYKRKRKPKRKKRDE
jgi:excisionase family DNA binding protein